MPTSSTPTRDFHKEQPENLPATMPNRETKWTSSITPGGIKRMLVPAPFEKAVTAILEEKGFHLPFPLKFVPLTEGEVKVHFHELELTVKAPDYASDLATEKQIFYTHIMRIE